MGNVFRFKKPRQVHLKGAARDSYSEAVRSVGKPLWVVIVACGRDGRFASRTVYDEDTQPFDVYSRTEALMNKHKAECIEC